MTTTYDEWTTAQEATRVTVDDHEVDLASGEPWDA